MSATTGERTDTLPELLREFAGKLAELNREFVALLELGLSNERAGRYAWLLDRAKRFDQPMRELVNHTASVIEHADLDGVGAMELTLRLGEAEAQLHHMLRQSAELQKGIDAGKIGEKVARLRESAGLNAMKGGPLRPKS